MQVKEIRNIETNELTGYIVDEKRSVPISDNNPWYKTVQQWIADGNVPEPAFTADELAAEAARKLILEAKSTGEVYSLNGADYQIPFKKDDADGLLQVKAAFDSGLLTETVIYFTNETKMPITSEEFDAFVAWFVPKRNAFFTL
jgi:hypothetical protein